MTETQEITFHGTAREVAGELVIRDAGGNPSHVIPLNKKTATSGPSALVISDVLAKTGLTLFTEGAKSASMYESKITLINADEGELFYRGYAIQDLMANSTYLEVCYLLRHGELPMNDELIEYSGKIFARMNDAVGDVARIQSILSGLGHDAEPMDMLGTLLTAVGAFRKGTLNIHTDPEQRDNALLTATAVMPVLVAMIHKFKTTGQAFINPPLPEKSLEENFLHMYFSEPGQAFNVDPQAAHELGKIMIAHADHEQNASTSALRANLSTGAQLFPSLASATNALAGPAHGGASAECLDMLDTILGRAKELGQGDVNAGLEQAADEAIARAKDKKDSFRLMGFGHRVYKNTDPRARAILSELEQKVGSDNSGYKIISMLVARTAGDEYFNEKGGRKIYANVDLASGMLERQLGFTTEMAVVLFALSRGAAGWPAHADEHLKAQAPIVRPYQVYTGPDPRDYIAIDNRGPKLPPVPGLEAPEVSPTGAT